MTEEKKAKKKCSACGTSPVNHTLLLVDNFLSDIQNIGSSTKTNGFNSTYQYRRLASYIEKFLFTGLSYVGIVSFNHDKEKSVTGRSKLIWEEAERRSIDMSQIVIFGRPVELYRAKLRNKFFYFKSLPIPLALPQGGYEWLDDKFILFKVLSENNVPVPKTIKIYTWTQAVKVFKTMNKPVIIKPKHGSRGRHTTTNINTEAELKTAFKLAREITFSMIMQEHLYGSVYRATIIDNKLVGFFRGDPPQIIGDGIKTIREHIAEKNKNRHERVSDIEINTDLINFIKREGYTLESVLPKDTTLNLTAKTGRMYGSYTKEMLDAVHSKLGGILKKAGALMDAPVVGFDLIIEDPTIDPEDQRWGIIECNSLPFIDLHYFALEGPQVNLAKNVWDLWN